jgi:hypothetical protein
MQRNQWRPRLSVMTGSESLISTAGGGLLAKTARGAAMAPEVGSA